MIRDSHRASHVLESIRMLFKSADLEPQPVDLNEIVLAALDVLRGELRDHRVIALTELVPELPLVPGHSVQLQEVMINLVRNAIDAMEPIADWARVLRVRTERGGREAIVVSEWRTSGPGIDSENLESILMRSLLQSHMEWGWDYPFAGSLFHVMKVSFQRGPTTKVARCFNLLCQLNRGDRSSTASLQRSLDLALRDP